MRAKKEPKKPKYSRQTVDAIADTTASAAGGVVRTVFKVLATILLIFITTGLLFACIFAYYVKTCLSSELDVTLTDVSLALSSTIWYTDSDGNYKELATLHSTENRVWVDYENIPVNMEHAAVAIEDKRFYDHKGVDWYRTVGAFGNMFLSMKNDFGGSTLTQQLIKNLTKQDDITVQRKLLEIFRALEFEKKYTKEEIVEWYLNTIYLGEGCYGIGTAANTYFNKEVWDLSLAECASLVGITNNPSLYDPYISKENNKKRQETILAEMYDQGYINYDEYQNAINEELVFKRGEDESYQEAIYDYYTEVVINDVLNDLVEKNGLSRSIAKQLLYSGGYNIYACIDKNIQNVVDSVYTDTSQIPSAYTSTGQQLQSAIVIVDPYDGDIVALSGGVGKKTGNFLLNRATGSQRPPGSSFKPIAVYAPALDLGLITQNTKINDSPNISLKGTTWYPRNSGGYSGIITIREGLRWSKNTVAAQILDKLGVETSVDYLQNRLGVTSLIDADHNYAPLSLGQLTNGITVREMAQAYSAFVNDGVFTYSRTYTHVTDANGNVILDNQPETIVAFKANTAWNMTNMLQYAVSSGTGTEASLGSLMPVAGKTGTTTDNKDRYFVGYTPYYIAAVWTGYDTPAYMNFSGNPAAQIWKKIMKPIHEGLEYKNFPTPTIGGDTGIFGNMMPEETESPSPSASTEPSPSHNSEHPSPTPDAPADTTPVDPVTPVPTTPVEPVDPVEPAA